MGLRTFVSTLVTVNLPLPPLSPFPSSPSSPLPSPSLLPHAITVITEEQAQEQEPQYDPVIIITYFDDTTIAAVCRLPSSCVATTTPTGGECMHFVLRSGLLHGLYNHSWMGEASYYTYIYLCMYLVCQLCVWYQRAMLLLSI